MPILYDITDYTKQNNIQNVITSKQKFCNLILKSRNSGKLIV